jgi:hypothetical protein
MSADSPLAEVQLPRGGRLTLYANRLVHQGGDSMETVPLAQLAAVGVGFERDPAKLGWAVALLVVALVCALSSGPLQSGIGALAASVKDHAGRESLEAVLLASFSALGALARLLVPLAVLLAAGAAALVFFFWYGATVLSFSFAATQRSHRVHGRDPHLLDFANSVAEQLAARKA